jgi:hypothetical protein
MYARDEIKKIAEQRREWEERVHQQKESGQTIL